MSVTEAAGVVLQFEQKVKSLVMSTLVFYRSADGLEILTSLVLRGYTIRLFPFPFAKVMLLDQ